MLAVSKMMAKLTNDPVCEIREAACQALSIINTKAQEAIETVKDEISPQIKGKLLDKESPRKEVTTDIEMPWDVAEAKICQNLNQKIVLLLSSSNIVERKEGFSMLLEFIRGSTQGDSLQDMHEHLIRFCKKQMLEWKEQNSDLINSCMLLLHSLISIIEISNKAAYTVLPFLIEKYGILKYKKPAMEVIYDITDSTGPELVIIKFISIINYVRMQPTIKDICSIMFDIVCEYPYKLLPIRQIIDCLCTLLPTHNKQIAIDIIKKLYSFAGPSIKTLLNDIKGSPLKLLNSELDNLQLIKEQKVTRILRGAATKILVLHADNSPNKLAPVDITSMLNANLIKDMSSDNWKARSDALTQIKQIISNANYKIQPNNLHEVFKLVGIRFKDSHKGVQKGYIILLGTLIDAIGSKIKQYHKFVLPNLIDVLADKQPTLRAEALDILWKFREATEGDYIIDMLAPYLIKDSPVQRIEILKWLTKEKIGYQSCDHKLLVPGIIQCLQDKLKDVRKMAEQILCLIIPYVSKDEILRSIPDEKPTVKQSLADTINTLFPTQCIAKVRKSEHFSDALLQQNIEAPNLKPTNLQIQPVQYTDNTNDEFFAADYVQSPMSICSSKVVLPRSNKEPIVILLSRELK
jgi:hypothetical protein